MDEVNGRAAVVGRVDGRCSIDVMGVKKSPKLCRRRASVDQLFGVSKSLSFCSSAWSSHCRSLLSVSRSRKTRLSSCAHTRIMLVGLFSCSTDAWHIPVQHHFK